MVAKTNSAHKLLETAYTSLNFDEGELLSASTSPNDLSMEKWIEKGDWLSTAKKVGAERIFFVNDNPVVVFADSDSQSGASVREIFNKIWCMARPRYLFLAKEGELAVYDLTQPPAKTDKEWKKIKPLATVREVAEVAAELHKYRREQIESGRLFEENSFGRRGQRADQLLINDLKAVRLALVKEGLRGSRLKYAHSIIGRSIFIRYLEDREVLQRKYFDKVAQGNPKWQALLDEQPNLANLQKNAKQLYVNVLQDKQFTYALYDQLAKDFNGDMFPSDSDEKNTIQQSHLTLLRDFLLGKGIEQQKLFFWAYNFEIIPTSLISSIYEEFYHGTDQKLDGYGTHYTPSSLVEFVLAKVLTPTCLDKNPRIIDPCCGSGIFLVESFRRIVRHRVHKNRGQRLKAQELSKILCDQISGIEINGEAIRVAAFSLYLSLLHCQEPRDILEQIELGQRLPNLIYQAGLSSDEQHFNNLLVANAFSVESDSNNELLLSKFGSNCADVVVGNPPWGSPTKDNSNSVAELEIATKWCRKRELSIGDKERSQAFLWRVVDLLREDGWAALLVSTGVFLKTHPNSKSFRCQWLSRITLKEVVNFAHVRDIFFRSIKKNDSVLAPFASVLFQKKPINSPQTQQSHVIYWSAKKTAMVQNLQAVVLSSVDRHVVRQIDLLRNDDLWKIYWWGSHRDAALISAIQLFTSLEELHDPNTSGQGFSTATENPKPFDLPSNYKKLPVSRFQSYGPIDDNWYEPRPKFVYRDAKRTLYEETRLLIKHGIDQSSKHRKGSSSLNGTDYSIKSKGKIVARVESKPFCFTNSINCIKLKDPEDWKYKVILGILWSSLPRYYFFLTSSKWGIWHDGIYKTEYLRLPIAFPTDGRSLNKIIRIVERLQNWDPIEFSVFNMNGRTQEELDNELNRLEEQLDEVVFDLYDLSYSERDLIHDMCSTGLDFFYNHVKSKAVQLIEEHPSRTHGTLANISTSRNHQSIIEGYIYAFLHIWNRELEPEGEFNWRIIKSQPDATLLAVVFSTQELGEVTEDLSVSDENALSEVLKKLGGDTDGLLASYKSSQIYIDGIVRAVSDTEIIIIKRNERRLWTRSMAREDAEATMLQAINLQEAQELSEGVAV